MYKQIPLSFLLVGLITISFPTWADSITVNDGDTVQTVLSAHMDKRVTIQTKSGRELTGTVKVVNKNLTHLSELSGKEYFDAVINNKNIEAVIIRTKQ